MLKFFLFIALLAAQSFGVICDGYGDFVQHNGHYYTVTKNRVKFSDAKALAENSNGYIAIPDTQAENDFLKSLIPGGKFAWIGLYDPNYSDSYCYTTAGCPTNPGRFRTVKGAAPSFSNWMSGQPDNLVWENDVYNGTQMVLPLGEHWAAMAFTGLWQDDGNHASDNNNPVKHIALFEFDTKPECYNDPSTVTDTIEGKKCQTEIYDTSTGVLSDGQAYDCQADEYGHEYCPSALAQCGQEWDYENGYSTSGIGQVVDYTSKVESNYTISMDFQNIIATNESKTCTQIGTRCAGENQTCSFSGTKMIAYGANGKYVYKVATSSIGCNNSNFGDPAPQEVKSCYIVNQADMTNNICPSGYTYLEWIGCAGENSTCYVDGIKTVRYGTSDKYNYKTISNSVYCSNTVFGDPYYGAVKTCSFKNTNIQQVATLTASCPTNTTDKNIWVTCASEGGNCNFSGTQVVRYGGDGKYYYKNNVTGSIKCDNNTFGDPAPGVTKGCSYSQGICEGKTISCPSDYTETTGSETTKGECKKTIEYTYYNYLCSNDPTIYATNYTAQNTGGNCVKTDPSKTTNNTATLDDPCNSSTPPVNNCKRQSFTCVAAPDRPCSYVNNSWQCSPFPCFGGSDMETTDAPVGINDANNDGWDNSGNCMGQLYIFPGKDYRCRSDDAFFGLFGGGCCDKDKVFGGLVQCKENEKKLAKLNKNDQCHYIGEYCSKKLKLGFAKICIQHSQSHCCFNGVLARIINEQGRIQLGKNWGSAEAPNCKGFTPDEFQKLDFSEIDMSEFFDDLQTQMSTEIMGNTGTYIQNKVSNILNQ